MDSPPHSPDPEQSTSRKTETDAEKPFDASAKADVILRSSDSVDFFALKAVLSVASPVFDGMFSLGQPEQGGGGGEEEEDNDTKNGLPIVRLEEDSLTLSNLLQLIYPYRRCELQPNTVEVYGKVGKAAHKYAMDGAMERWKEVVAASQAVTKEPLRIFAIATHFGLADLMRKAALNTLAVRLSDILEGEDEELKWVSGADLRALLRWRFDCQGTVQQLLDRWQEDQSSSSAIMAEHLEDRLKETGCPRANFLMSDSVVANTIRDSVTEWTVQEYRDVMRDRTSMRTQMAEAVSKVCLHGRLAHCKC